MRFSTTVTLAAAAGTTLAQIQGFNSGASDDTGKAKSVDDFKKEFTMAHELSGLPGSFSTVRLYSNIQWQTPDTPIAAFDAAIQTNTKLLLGIWASGSDNIDNELSALSKAIKQYGSKFTDLVVGISVGSEDLYRTSVAGIAAKVGVGNTPDNIVKFIKQTREFLAGTPLKNTKVTHVDTWTTWTNGTNKAVIDAIDFVAVNAFPLYEQEHDNRIDNAAQLLSNALAATDAAAGGKDVWLTETGWAYTGPDFGAAKATNDNAAKYWQDVGCAVFGKRNTFWYTLRDANPDNKVKFAVADYATGKPRYELSCKEKKSLPSAGGSSNSTSPSPSGSITPNSSGTPSTSNDAQQTTGAAKGKNAGAATSVTFMNSMAMGLSVVVAIAAWAL